MLNEPSLVVRHHSQRLSVSPSNPLRNSEVQRVRNREGSGSNGSLVYDISCPRLEFLCAAHPCLFPEWKLRLRYCLSVYAGRALGYWDCRCRVAAGSCPP